MKKRKILVVFIILILLLNVGTNCSIANTGVWDTGKQWLSSGDGSKVVQPEKYQSNISELAGLLYGIGIAMGVIAVAVLGISFFTASSSDDKANIKKKATIVAIGLFILFASVTIWQIVVNILSSNS